MTARCPGFSPSRRTTGLLAAIGPSFARYDDGRVVDALAADERHLNFRGFVHGAVIACVLDIALGDNIVAASATAVHLGRRLAHPTARSPSMDEPARPVPPPSRSPTTHRTEHRPSTASPNSTSRPRQLRPVRRRLRAGPPPVRRHPPRGGRRCRVHRRQLGLAARRRPRVRGQGELPRVVRLRGVPGDHR